jgi:hypothetical protein
MRSRQLLFWAICLGLAALPTTGCMKPIVARYVYQDHDFGVVAIPMNTYLGKASFRDEADELMARHFPDGYEIVRAEEVNEGERTLDVGKKTQFETEPNLTALNQMIKLGKLDQTTSFEQKDKIQVRECRIIYKRKLRKSPEEIGQFAALNSLNPRFYIDPNEMVRRQNEEMVAKNALAMKKTSDHDVQKASAAGAATSPGEPAPASVLQAAATAQQAAATAQLAAATAQQAASTVHPVSARPAGDW